MLHENKKLTNARLFFEHENMFLCPICLSSMKVVNLRSLICSSHHCFDISKKGYVNFITHPLKTKYDKQMFESRKMISANGFFEPLIAQICGNIINEWRVTNRMISILDAGCGEGSHLSNIQQKLIKQVKCNLLGVGIDISKEGINIASRGSSRAIWCIADLTNCPFKDQSFNFILNILSPSNYSEFQRMLADDGMVIKVIPESKYLQELRGIFYKQTDRTIYSNKNTIELFKQNFDLVDIQHVQYDTILDHEYIAQLVHMTPLSWGASDKLKKQVLSQNKTKITFDFSILLGKKKNMN